VNRALAAALAAGVMLFTSSAPRAQVRKHVLAWADVRNGYQHDSISHAVATVERLGRESGAYDTFIRTDSQLITKHPITFPAGTGIRVDTHVQPGARVPPEYDSLLAKLVVHGRDRSEACARLQSALRACSIEGVETNLGLHRSIVAAPDFLRGGVDTRWLPEFLAARQQETGR